MSHRKPRHARGVSRRLCLAFALVFGTSCADERIPIYIGVAGPMTSRMLADHRHGAELAVDEANARGGINGRPLAILRGDDSGRAVSAVTVAANFVQDQRVVAVAGHMSSGAMLAAAQLYDGRLAAVATMATSPELTNVSPWVFRIASSDAALAKDLARFALSRKWLRIAVLYQNDAYGRALSTAFTKAFEASGGEVVTIDALESQQGRFMEFGVFIRTYFTRRPDAIVLVTDPLIGMRFLRETSASKLHIPIIGSDGWPVDPFAADPAADGVYIPSSFLDDSRDTVASRFRVKFKARFGHEPDMFAATSYDAMLAIIAAIRSAGTDRTRVRDALASMQTAPVQGVTGPISFSAGDRVQRIGGLVRIENGMGKTYLRWKDALPAP
ncbi:MAG: ABC transporter substrate-binding protein [bacterium]